MPVTDPCTVVIGAEDVLLALKQRAASLNGSCELLAFSDEEPLRALETITKRKPMLVDLSAVGAQVIAPAGLKPNQRAAIAFNDGVARFTCDATVIWTSFDMAGAEARFRMGLDFIDPDAKALTAYAQRHKT